MGILNGTRCYLAGPVDHDSCADQWRVWVADKLEQAGIQSYDPLVKPDWLHGFAHADPSYYYRALEEGGPLLERTYEAMTDIRKACMAQVASADFMICNLPKRFTFGTIMELQLFDQMNKPLFIHSPDGIASTWAFHQFSDPARLDDVFYSNWESLLARIEAIDKGDVELDPFQWISISYFNPEAARWSKCTK